MMNFCDQHSHAQLHVHSQMSEKLIHSLGFLANKAYLVGIGNQPKNIYNLGYQLVFLETVIGS